MVSRTIVLESGSFCLVTSPCGSKKTAACGQWFLNGIYGGERCEIQNYSYNF